MWIRNGGLLAAVIAVFSIAAVAVAAWFALVHASDWNALVSSYGKIGTGLATLITVLVAGWLLATAFDRAEEAVVLYKQRTHSDSKAGD